MTIPVILDTDIGSDVDDTWALALLLRSPELDLKLVLTATCDTVYRARIAAKLLQTAGRTDVPVGIGLRGAPAHEYQRPWVETYDLSAYPGTVHEQGIQAMIDLIRHSPEPVTIIAISAATNLAHALRIAPDIAEKCRFVGMFGSVDRGYGEGSSPLAEANVKGDIAAARQVFAAPWRETLITPLDTCDQVILSGEAYQRIRRADDPLLRAVIENYRIWAPLVPWVEIDDVEMRSSTLFDTVAVYMAYSLELLQMETMRLSITDAGLTVRDEDGAAVQVALAWRDLPAFREHLTERLLRRGR